MTYLHDSLVNSYSTDIHNYRTQSYLTDNLCGTTVFTHIDLVYPYD